MLVTLALPVVLAATPAPTPQPADALTCPSGTAVVTAQKGAERFCADRRGIKHGPYLMRDAASGKIAVRGQYRRGQRTGTWTHHAASGTTQTGRYDAKGRTGRWETRDAAGKLTATTMYLRDRRQGMSEQYFPSGALQLRAEYRDDKHHGAFQMWHTPGRLRMQGRYGDGQRVGRWRWWYPDGTPQMEISFDQALRHGPFRAWHDNGQLHEVGRYDDGMLSGPHQRYGRDGKLLEEGTYLNGRREGLWHHYDATGELGAVGSYIAGRRRGQWKVWEATRHDVRRLLGEGEFGAGGKREGLWRWFDPKGARVRAATYTKGELTGEGRGFHPNGTVSERGQYLNGRRVGPWPAWHDNGKLAESRTYKSGQLVGRYKRFDRDGSRLVVGAYVVGLESGRWQHFRADGTLRRIEHYNRGEPAGNVQEFYANGKLKFTGYIANKAKHGRWQYFDRKGELLSAGVMAQDAKHGYWVERADGKAPWQLIRYDRGSVLSKGEATADEVANVRQGRGPNAGAARGGNRGRHVQRRTMEGSQIVPDRYREMERSKGPMTISGSAQMSLGAEVPAQGTYRALFRVDELNFRWALSYYWCRLMLGASAGIPLSGDNVGRPNIDLEMAVAVCRFTDRGKISVGFGYRTAFSGRHNLTLSTMDTPGPLETATDRHVLPYQWRSVGLFIHGVADDWRWTLGAMMGLDAGRLGSGGLRDVGRWASAPRFEGLAPMIRVEYDLGEQRSLGWSVFASAAGRNAALTTADSGTEVTLDAPIVGGAMDAVLSRRKHYILRAQVAATYIGAADTLAALVAPDVSSKVLGPLPDVLLGGYVEAGPSFQFSSSVALHAWLRAEYTTGFGAATRLPWEGFRGAYGLRFEFLGLAMRAEHEMHWLDGLAHQVVISAGIVFR